MPVSLRKAVSPYGVRRQPKGDAAFGPGCVAPHLLREAPEALVTGQPPKSGVARWLPPHSILTLRLMEGGGTQRENAEIFQGAPCITRKNLCEPAPGAAGWIT